MQKETRKLKIFIFDDHDSVRESYIRWLEFEGFKVLGGEKSLENCLELLKKHRPDIVLLDIDYPEEEFAGIKVAKQIASDLPGVKTVFVSHYTDPNIIAKAFASGASGYFAKSDELRFLKEVIEKVSENHVALSPTATKKLTEAVSKQHIPEVLVKRDFHLTDQETKILGFIARGLSNKEIAEQLHTNEKRIKNVIAALLAKLNAKNRAHAVAIGITHGLIDVSAIAT
jgi:DNA-binding NarL/FixJ family response regulator